MHTHTYCGGVIPLGVLTNVLPIGSAEVAGTTDADRLETGVDDVLGGGGISVLSTRVAFFFGFGAAISFLPRGSTHHSGFHSCRTDGGA